VRIDGQNAWNWVFQNGEVVIHVIRHSRAAGVVGEVMAGHRPVIWVSDLYGVQRGHAEEWQICLAHQLRDCQFAIPRLPENPCPLLPNGPIRILPVG
jgi:transposase